MVVIKNFKLNVHSSVNEQENLDVTSKTVSSHSSVLETEWEPFKINFPVLKIFLVLFPLFSPEMR